MSDTIGLLFPGCSSQPLDGANQKRFSSAFTHLATSLAIAIIVGIGAALAAYFLTHGVLMWGAVGGGIALISGFPAYVILRCSFGKVSQDLSPLDIPPYRPAPFPDDIGRSSRSKLKKEEDFPKKLTPSKRTEKDVFSEICNQTGFYAKKLEKISSNLSLYSKRAGLIKKIYWVTGNNSGVLVGLNILKKIFYDGCTFFMGSAQLLTYDVPLFSGELNSGIWIPGGDNSKMLSGVRPEHFYIAYKYANLDLKSGFSIDFDQELDALSIDFLSKNERDCPKLRSKIAALRIAYLKEYLTPEQISRLEEMKSRMRKCVSGLETPSDAEPQWEKYASLIGRKIEGIPLFEVHAKKDHEGTPLCKKGSLVVNLKTKMIGMITNCYQVHEESSDRTDSEVWKYEVVYHKDCLSYGLERHGENFLPYIPTSDQASDKKDVTYPLRSLIHPISLTIDLLEILEAKNLSYSLTKEDKSYLDDPFPIVWASTNPKFPGRFAARGLVITNVREEVLVEGPLEVGKDINVAFTTKRSVKRLREWVTQHNLNLRVATLSTGLYLQIAQQNES
ncbi:MAG: hypothetical protein JJU12_03190 [Chlamydiales bacterium]|nr:hypothetical protein [Chlamydiales bacterium]